MSDAGTLVRDFLTHLENDETEAALALLGDGFEWRNSKLPTLNEKATASTFAGLVKRGVKFSVEVHHLAVDGDTVLTDRTDYLHYGRFTSSFWVRGNFVVRDGKIVLWDDRYSVADVAVGTLKGLLGIFGR